VEVVASFTDIGESFVYGVSTMETGGEVPDFVAVFTVSGLIAKPVIWFSLSFADAEKFEFFWF
jgi:hypothetical protein